MSAPVRLAAQPQAELQARRKRGIQAIKATQRQLGLDDDAYRAMLQAQTGKRSATELSLSEQGRLLEHMRRLGAPNPAQARREAARAGGRRRGTPVAEKGAMLSKLGQLLDELGRVTGQPHTLNYADAICKRNGWAERVDFCSPADLHSLVGAVARTLRKKAADVSQAIAVQATPCAPQR